MEKSSLNILVVDDDRNFARTLCAILQSEGYQCQEAYSAKDARAILLGNQFDFVLSDVRMQDQSGLDLYNQIREQLPNLPFILMTAYTSSEIIEDALAAGVLAAFQKPIDITAILQYFARLSQSLRAAVISENNKIRDMLQFILEGQRFSFSLFNNVDQFLQSGNVEFAIILVDAHEGCDELTARIGKLLLHIPDQTIVIICDLKKNDAKKDKYENRLNLIILPRENKVEPSIKSIIQKQYYKQARKIILQGKKE